MAQIFWRKTTNGQEPRARRQEPDAKSQTLKSQRSRARHQEPDAKIHKPRTRRQESDAKSQRSRARHQEPDAKSQMPKLHGKSEKSQIQMGHPWNQHLTPKLSLLMIFWCHSEQHIIFWKTEIAITRRVSRNLLNYGTQHSWFEYRIIQTKIH